MGKIQDSRFFLAFEGSDSAQYEVGVRNNLGGDGTGSWRTHCYSFRIMNYLQGGHFESEYFNLFHISTHTHTQGNLLQVLIGLASQQEFHNCQVDCCFQ